MARALKSGRVRFNRLARRGAFALLAGLLVRGVLGGLATSPALAALPAFDVSPASLTIQAGDTATGTLSNLPVGAGDPAEPGCLGATGTVPSYLTVSFSTLCSSGPNWSSSLTVKTIPATPAGTYTIVFEVCPTACYIAPDVRSPRTIDTKSWTVVVTPAPVPVETVPFTSAPAGSPAPASQTPHPSPTPSHSVPRTVLPPATSPPGTQPATSTPTPAASPSPGTSPAVASGGVAPGLVLDHSAVAAGQTLRVSGTGCAPAAPAIVAMPGSVTGTTTAGPDGAFQVRLQVPSSLRAGRYPVVAQCGTTLSAFVDVQRPRSIGTAVVLAIAAVVILLAGAAVGWFTRGRRRAGPS